MQKIIDVHAHVGNSAALYVAGSTTAVTERMRAAQITHSVISPIPGFSDPEGKLSVFNINSQLREIQAAAPDRYPLALAVAEPRHGKAALEEVEHALGVLELDGLMFHNDFDGVEMHSRIMNEILEEAQRYKNLKTVMLHTAQHSMLEPPFAMWILAEKFPDIIFICGHPMMSVIQFENMAAIVRHCPNVYLDTCLIWSHNRMVERAVEAMGSADCFLFGTDNPYFHKNLCIDKLLIERADISPADKENIFHGNFERVFGEVK